VNEELQSTNEELETSKEELQSVNEELATVNAELQTKVADLSRANNDMNNLLAGTGMATLFVDHQLRIFRFTPSATELINLIQSDIGRPVAHIVSNLAGNDSMVQDIQAVMRDLAPREAEVQTHAGAWFLMRIRPYRTLDNIIEGAVITFTDITESKRIGKELAEREREFNSILKSVFSPFALFESVFDGNGKFINSRIVFINDAYERLTGVTNEQARGKTAHEIWPGAESRIIETYGQVAVSGVPSRFEMRHEPTAKRYLCHVFRPGESRERFCVIFEDITDRPLSK
jgi:two-component system CheB/CheR fusion protein